MITWLLIALALIGIGVALGVAFERRAHERISRQKFESERPYVPDADPRTARHWL